MKNVSRHAATASELTTEADRPTSQGSVSELSECVLGCGAGLQGKQSPTDPHTPVWILHYSERNTKPERERDIL